MFAASKTKQVSSAAVFVEDVMSTYVYTGTGSDQTLTTGVDLSTYGGMIWSKRRSAVENHFLQDTNRGLASRISSNTTGAAATTGAWPMNAISTTGMTVSGVNYAAGGETYVSWTFRKQPKFFDVVTFTGDGSASLAVNHNLGSVPGCVIVKRTDSGGGWFVWHRATSGTPNNDYIRLEQTSAVASATNAWSGNAFTSTQFFVSNNLSTNVGGATYVAYLFAHNAGGFGLTGTDNVISCGSFTTDGTGNASVTLGYEPQWLLIKSAGSTESWYVLDNMRGLVASPGTTSAYLVPNSSQAESTWGSVMQPTATGFTTTGLAASTTYIYIAIRRGPMKTPTSGTSVYESTTSPASGSPGFTAGFPVDFAWLKRPAFTGSNFWGSRLTGAAYLDTTDTAAEQASGNWTWDYQSGWFATGLGSTYRSWMIRRAPGFFDEVCRAGFDTATTHNLGVTPELIIVKNRNYSGGSPWPVYHKDLGVRKELYLNTTAAPTSFGFDMWSANASTFTYADSSSLYNYVAYLFASCPGVSKVGSYTGTGATQTINCGFTGGARWVMIKRTDSTGDWYVWDTARGMVSGTDPSLLLNSTAAEVNANSVYTTSVGFQIVSTAAGINASGGSYIFLAIA